MSGDKQTPLPEGDSAELDLRAYLKRIDYAGELRPSADVLHALHLAHATHIPFENLDILLNRPIRLDLGSLQAKLVAGRRGGYCFEQNLLFAAALRAFGFPVRALAARVHYRAARVLPRTHMLLLVDIGARTWLADVGFGGEGLLGPVPFEDGRAATQFAWTYRIVAEDGHWMLQSLRPEGWMDLYSFTEEPQHSADFEMANYYMSTHPSSRFVRTLTVQLPTPQQRVILRNRELAFDRGSRIETRVLAGDDELIDVLRDVFGLRFERGTRFAYREAAD